MDVNLRICSQYNKCTYKSHIIIQLNIQITFILNMS